MNVKELIDVLSTMNQDMEVIMQKDSEGNGSSPCAGADADCIYVAESTWYGEVYDTTWDAGDAGMDEDEWEDFKALHPRAVVLYPVN